jgi:hypothetical protein
MNAGVVESKKHPPPRLQTLALLGLDPPLLARRGIFKCDFISITIKGLFDLID